MSEQLKEQILYNSSEFSLKNLFWVDRYVSGAEGPTGTYESRRIPFDLFLQMIEDNIDIPTGVKIFHNNTGGVIEKGTICVIDGVGSGIISIAEFDRTQINLSQLYVAIEDINNGVSGNFIQEGPVTGIDTSGFAVGDVLFYENGIYSITRNDNSIFAGVVLASNVNGTIYYSPTQDYSVVRGQAGEVALFVGTDQIKSNSRFTFVDVPGVEVGYRIQDTLNNLLQVGLGYINMETEGTAQNGVIRMANWSSSFTNAISFRKSRGTKASPSGVLANDILGQILGAGQHNSNGGTTTFEAKIVASEDYEVDLVSGYPEVYRYALTELQLFMASSIDTTLFNPPFPNPFVFGINGDGRLRLKNFTFPANDGVLGQALVTNGLGQIVWGNPSTGGVSGTGTANYLPLWTTSSQLGNSLIRQEQNCLYIGDTSDFVSKFYIGSQDEPTGLNVNVQQQDFTIAINFYSSGDYICNGIIGSVYSTGKSIGAKINSFSGGYDEAIGGQFKAEAPNYRAIGIISEAKNLGTGGSYCFQGIDGSEGVGKVLTCMNNEGMANWVDISSVTDYIPRMKGNEVFRGVTFQNNSTTITTYGGITNNLSGSQGANSVATTNYRTRQHTMRFEPSVVQTGQYCCMRSSAQLWSVTGGFYFVAEFGISDSNYSVGTHNFWGLCNSTSNLPIGTVSNSQPSVIPNIIAVANDSTDANLQIMHNDDIGNANKIDLGSAFPANRTSGSALTNMYLVEFYNAPSSTEVKYRVTNKETGNVAQGVLLSNLPNSTTLLAYQAGRSMGTTGGGISQTGRFDVSRLGVYSI